MVVLKELFLEEFQLHHILLVGSYLVQVVVKLLNFGDLSLDIGPHSISYDRQAKTSKVKSRLDERIQSYMVGE